MKNVLVVAAHPDDEILGCGGTMARMAEEGKKVYTLILGEGATARDRKRDRKKKSKELEDLRKQALKANRVLGVKETCLHDFPDNRFDTVALLDIVKVIEDVKNRVEPEVILTHYRNDLNIDHQITYQAVLTATRPLPGETVRKIYSFEVLSSTEWSYPLSFSPDTFFDISKTVDIKLKAMKQYKAELRAAPHPRSLEGIKLIAKTWGMKVGLKSAEAFKLVRSIC